MRTEILNNLNRIFSFFMLTLAVIVVLILSGCGGSSSGGSTSGGSATLGSSVGQITGFGSIFVNGVRFHTGGAELEFEDGSTLILNNDNNEDHLSVGMEVEVEGSFDDNGSGTATRVSIDSTLDGPIVNLNQAGDLFTFTILGQTVIAVNGSTQVDDSILNGSLSNLAEGMVIEVHGLPDGSGHIQASFIEWKATDISTLTPGSLELTGTVGSLDSLNENFMVGSQLISYSGITPRDGILANGVLVEVKGNLNGVTFEATDIEVKNGFDDQFKMEVEGLITNLNTAAMTFVLKGQLIDYRNALFIGGVEADLLNGLKVEAEGPVSGGILQAVKVKFKDNFRYEGNSTLVGNSLIITNPGGTDLSVLIDSAITRGTASGGPVKLRARQLSGENLLAIRVEDNNDDRRQIFMAPVISISGSVVELLDSGNGVDGVIVVDTSSISAGNFEIGDVVTDRNNFFATLRVGDLVKARWDEDDNRWDQIEIELDD